MRPQVKIKKSDFWQLVRMCQEIHYQGVYIFQSCQIDFIKKLPILTIRFPQYPPISFGGSQCVADLEHAEIRQILISNGIDDEFLKQLKPQMFYIVKTAEVFKDYEIILIPI
ncbi:MAG: hypothetical protein RLZZ628_3135 [Bacteroidota bacterium]|jgi:hypothetical protein